MELIDDDGIVCAVRPHRENDAVVQLLLAGHGLRAGYVHAARSRRLRPLLQAGALNRVSLRGRDSGQLPTLSVEPLRSTGALLAPPAAAAAVQYAAGLLARTLPEGEPEPALFALFARLSHDAASEPAGHSLALLARLELALLDALGFGLDLSCCAATGSSDDLAYVSPRSMRAVSRSAGAPWAGKLLPLPPLLRDPPTAGLASPPPAELADALSTTGHFLRRALADDVPPALWDLRARAC